MPTAKLYDELELELMEPIANEMDEIGYLRGPLKQWNNDDLMLAEDTREKVMADRPRAFRVLDWPEMRELFGEIDTRSLAAKSRVRSAGTKAVLTAASGLVIAALATWLLQQGSWSTRVVGVLAATLLILGIIKGVLPRLRGHQRSAWLITRMQAERLRQLHFQLLLGNFSLAVKAMEDPAALQELQEVRSQALARFRDNYFAGSSAALQEVLQDVTARCIWQNETWSRELHSGGALMQEDATQLLDALRRLRFGVQRHYASLLVQEHASAPQVRANWLDLGANILTVGLVVASLTLAVSLIGGFEIWERGSISIAAVCAAGIAAMRTLEDGLRYGDESRRMGWYLAAIDALESGYDQLQVTGRVRVHKQLEHIAYREMHEFLASNHEARFILQ